jgi:glycerophosphoryl diester phosphodiesterase
VPPDRVDAPRPPREVARAVVALAHRGAHGPGVVENTVAALHRARQLGYAWVETDVHASADGVAVLAHDPSLVRLAGLDAALADLSWEQLAAVALTGAPDARLVRLEDALDAVPGLRLNLDVKAAGAVAPVVALLVRRPELVDRVRVTSFAEGRRRAVLAGLRAAGVGPVRSSASAPGALGCWLAARAPLPRALRAALVRALAALMAVDCLQLPETAVLRAGRGRRPPLVLRVVDARLLDAAHAAGLAVHVWVVDEPAEMHRLLDAGVDGLVTDRAAALAEVLTARGQWPPPPEPPAAHPRSERSPR